MPDMDTSRYYRPVSPSRRMANPMRASTGTVGDMQYYYSSPRTSRDSFANPRSSAERIDDASRRTVPRAYNNQSPPSAQLREYRTTRPRRATLEVPDPRHSLSSLPARSPTRARPIVHAPTTARASSPLAAGTYDSADDEAYYLTPASAARRQHRRVYSVDRDHHVNRIGCDDESRARTRRAAERGYLPTKRYPGERRQVGRRYEDDEYGYSYTDPKEQMYRDTAPRQRSRRSSIDGAGRNGTWSMSALEGTLPRVSVSREAGPPPSTRGFDKIGRSESLRAPTRGYASERPSRDYLDTKPEGVYDPLSSSSSRRAHRPVSLHQDMDRSYPYRDDGLDVSHRSRASIDGEVERRGFGIRTGGAEKHSPRTSNRELYAPYYADDDYYDRYGLDPRDYKHDHDYDYDYEYSRQGRDAAVAREYEKRIQDDDTRHEAKDYGRQSRDSSDGEARERRRRREQYHRDREEAEALEREERRRASDRDSDRSYDSGDRHHHRRRRHRKYADHDSSDTTVETKPDRQDRQDRQKPLEIVSPPEKDRETNPNREAQSKDLVIKDSPEPPRKGILKEPTQKFPEDPAPVREGVAPLKEAGKKGIPPGARWTKIDRRLVNPEALEEAHERFEERQDYVIVLRVLTKEEIQELAAKTQDIRDARYERDRRDRRDRRHRQAHAHAHARRHDEYAHGPLRIEAAPYSSSTAALAGGDAASTLAPGSTSAQAGSSDAVSARY